MKRVAVALVIVLLALIPALGMVLPGNTPLQAAERGVSLTDAAPHYRTFLEYELMSMPGSGGNYSCLMSQPPFTCFSQEWHGVRLSYLLDVEVGLKTGTTGIKLISGDGYSATLTLEQLRNANPQSLYAILAWKKGEEGKTGGPYQALDNKEGPFRLIVPQEKVGPNGTGTPNWNLALKMVRAIEVQPTPAGMAPVDGTRVPAGEIVVYGNIQNRRTYTVNQIKSIKPVTVDMPWKNTFPTKGVTGCTGVPFNYFMNTVIGLQAGTTGVNVLAPDGYSSDFTLDQVTKRYPGGLSMLLAWNMDGENLGPEPDGSGPLEMVLPQTDPEDTNRSSWVKNARVFTGNPKAGATGPDHTKVPLDRAIFYGSISPNNIPSTWYLAEGYTGGGFEEWICIMNPNSWMTRVDIEYMIEGEEPETQRVNLEPRTRTTVRVNDQVGDGKNVSAKVTGVAGDSIIAERAMYWNGRAGGHCAAGVTSPATEWYLAEGATAGGFETWVLVQNPGDEAAKVSITCMNASGENAGPSFDMPARSRKTVNIAETLKDDWQVSTKVTSTKPVIAERAMYWNNRKAGHCATGVTTPGNQWYLAEGSTAGGFETWVLVQNPGDNTAHINVTYMNASGEKAGPELDLAPNSRTTIEAAKTLPGDWQVSTKIASSQPVIAERAMYWNGRNGGHCENGIDAPKFTTYLAEGSTAGGFETWILLQNSGPSAATVYITYQTEAGPVDKAPVELAAGKRVSIKASDDVGETFQVSARVSSTAPIAVERAVYWNNRDEGSCAKGYASF